MTAIRRLADREVAETIAKFRTPAGYDWRPLAADIEYVLGQRPYLWSSPAIRPELRTPLQGRVN